MPPPPPQQQQQQQQQFGVATPANGSAPVQQQQQEEEEEQQQRRDTMLDIDTPGQRSNIDFVTRVWQGLTLVHFSAQLEPCLTQDNTLHTLCTP
jgi:hypothetical protein